MTPPGGLVGNFGSIGNLRVDSGNVEASSKPTAIGALCFGDRGRSLFIVSGVTTAGACFLFNIFGLVSPALGEIVGKEVCVAFAGDVGVAIGEGAGVTRFEGVAAGAEVAVDIPVDVEEDVLVLAETTDRVAGAVGSLCGSVVPTDVDFGAGVVIVEEATFLGAVLI